MHHHNIVFYIIRLPTPVTSTTGYFILLCLSLLILSGTISPLFSSSILVTYQPGEFIFQCHIFLPFHTVHGILKAKIFKWFAIPFFNGSHFVRFLLHDPSSFSSVQFSQSVVSDSLQPHESQHARPPCPSPSPRVHSNSCPSSW